MQDYNLMKHCIMELKRNCKNKRLFNFTEQLVQISSLLTSLADYTPTSKS